MEHASGFVFANDGNDVHRGAQGVQVFHHVARATDALLPPRDFHHGNGRLWTHP